MADYDRRYRQARDQLDRHHTDGIIYDRDYEAIRDFLHAYNPDKHRQKPPSDDTTKSKGTIARWGRQLDRLCRFTHSPICDHTADDLNRLMDDLLDGTHEDAPTDGYAHSTVRQYQLTVRKFLRFSGQSEASHDVYILPIPETNVDKQDMFSSDEIEAMRNVIDNSRDQAMFDLFLFTGQRLTAIQTLRIKDVDVDEGTFRLNPDVPGLKGAGGYRPLLGAQASVRDWLQKHPDDSPDSYLLTYLPAWNRCEKRAGEMLSENAFRRVLAEIGDRAGVEKPVNPHNFRHNFVTMAYKEYDMDKDTIRHLIGHSADSRVMETTYSHLDDDDYIELAEKAADIREEDESSSLTPKTCPTCGDALAPDAKACGNCGTVFTPDAQAVKEQVERDVYESAKETVDEDVQAGLDDLREMLRENPELLDELAGE